MRCFVLRKFCITSPYGGGGVQPDSLLTLRSCRFSPLTGMGVVQGTNAHWMYLQSISPLAECGCKVLLLIRRFLIGFSPLAGV